MESANICVNMSTKHPSYALLGGRILVSNLHKNTKACYYETVKTLYDYIDVNNNSFRLIATNIMTLVETHKDLINSMLNYDRDHFFDYFGFKTLVMAQALGDNRALGQRKFPLLRLHLQDRSAGITQILEAARSL